MIAKHVVVLDLERGDPGLRAITRFEHRDVAASAAARIPQGIKGGVIPFGDIAALRGVEWRRWDQRAREQIDQRAVAVEPGQEFGHQRRRVSGPCDPFPHEARLTQTVAQLAQIARSTAPGRETPQCPCYIGKCTQRRPQRLSRASILDIEGNQVEPRLDRRPVHERRTDVACKEACAARRHGPVDCI